MRTTRVLRWTVPIGVAGVVAAVTLLPSATTATANPALPSRTPGQLLADAAGSTVTGLSGTVVQTARLGLPELPAQSGATSGPLSLISGSHTIKVWLDGPQRQRLALVSQLAEYNVVHNGRDVWTYASETNKATHCRCAALMPTGHPGRPRHRVIRGAMPRRGRRPPRCCGRSAPPPWSAWTGRPGWPVGLPTSWC